MQRTILAILLTVISTTAIATLGIASHCAKDEAVLFSCNMKSKAISFCASPQKQPFTSIEYRYGKLGNVEMSYKATSATNLLFADVMILPKAGLESIWFKKGDFTYAVSECDGMGCGDIQGGLVVYKGNKRIVKNICNVSEISGFKFPVEFGDEVKSKSDLIIHKKSDLDFDLGGE